MLSAREPVRKKQPVSVRSWAAAGMLGATVAVVSISATAAAPRSSTGTLVFATAGDRSDRLEIAIARPDGTGVQKLTYHDPGGTSPSWATDGRSIVFETFDSFSDYDSLWRIKPNGKGLREVPVRGEPSPSATRFARLTRHGVDIVSAKGRIVRRMPLRLGPDDDYNDRAVLWSSDDGYLAISVDTETENADYTRVFVARVGGHRRPRALSRRKPRGELDEGELPLAWSADGRRLLLFDFGIQRTFIVTAATGERREVRNFDCWGATATTPDLSNVACVTKAGVIVGVPLAGGPKRVLAKTRGGRKGATHVDLSWSPTGRELVYSDRDGIHVVDRSRSRRRRVTSLGAWSSPRWAPDGRRLVFSVGAEAIYIVGRKGRGLRPLTRSIWDDSPRWSPDGTKIAFLRGPHGLDDPLRLRVVVVNRDGGEQRTIGRGYGPRWSPDGSLLSFVDPVRSTDPAGLGKLRAGDIVVAAPDGTGRRVIARGTSPAWSPTGSRIAFLRYVFESEHREIVPVRSRLFVVGPDGAGLREVGVPEDPDGVELVLYSPEWAPDGHTLVFAAVRGITTPWSRTLFVDVDQPGRTQLLDFADAGAYVWSPDGQLLAFREDDDVKTARPDGSGIRTLSRGVVEPSAPVWSPDGNALAFDACIEHKHSESQTCDVYVVAADGSAQTRVTRTPGREGAVDWGP